MTDDYTYRFNGHDGTFDVIEIVNPKGKVIATLYYWDDSFEKTPNNAETKRVIKATKTICKHLNHWQIGEWKQVTVGADGRVLPS
jgi:hypothetical protein